MLETVDLWRLFKDYQYVLQKRTLLMALRARKKFAKKQPIILVALFWLIMFIEVDTNEMRDYAGK